MSYDTIDCMCLGNQTPDCGRSFGAAGINACTANEKRQVIQALVEAWAELAFLNLPQLIVRAEMAGRKSIGQMSDQEFANALTMCAGPSFFEWEKT